ncbi:hypothetical protein EVAR_33279_1 [Eumeta japonica]|uniref:Uncharacterized protein n=1 Tax=Eumeta variegata TaxID=151549 RepID=A0A4C1X2Y5_EUMVA|nr:hypothetical protein EVAR_33279_1 [Eumeta japonica]
MDDHAVSASISKRIRSSVLLREIILTASSIRPRADPRETGVEKLKLGRVTYAVSSSRRSKDCKSGNFRDSNASGIAWKDWRIRRIKVFTIQCSMAECNRLEPNTSESSESHRSRQRTRIRPHSHTTAASGQQCLSLWITGAHPLCHHPDTAG